MAWRMDPGQGARAACAVRLTVQTRGRLRLRSWRPPQHLFSTSLPRSKILDASSLPERIVPQYLQTPTSSLLSLHWPRPLRNVLLIPKRHAPHVLLRTLDFAKHIHASYPDLNLVFEPRVAEKIHDRFSHPIYSLGGPSLSEDGDASDPQHPSLAPARKIDVVATLGGDGTILRAASLFSTENSVPPLLSFSMGTLGFLGEWKFDEYKRAWREAYMSGSSVAVEDLGGPHTQKAISGSAVKTGGEGGSGGSRGSGVQSTAWDHVRGNGKSMGATRASKILLRDRLRVGIYDHEGRNVNARLVPTSTTGPDLQLPLPEDSCSDHAEPARTSSSAGRRSQSGVSSPRLHAINEVSIDRGSHPHLAIIDIFVNNSFLTEAVADGILISTPTGSTAYSLSAGGAIVHPLVKALLITPISPRSLSFRPLVLPLNTKVALRLSRRNRGRELPVSIDGKRRLGVSIGMEVRVEGETSERTAPDAHGNRGWVGGVPCVMRSTAAEPGGRAEEDDPWVGGLNGLLKFNYPFGEPGDVP